MRDIIYYAYREFVKNDASFVSRKS
jgi:hypothetical protein